ncbi:MAG: acyltransferase [Muribaculaceae bacterium]
MNYVRDRSLDVARGLSMLYIVGVWHLNNYTDAFSLAPWGEYVKNASLGLFMFLSGYLLGGRYVVCDVGSFWRFLRGRVLRILPLFALSLLMYYNLGKISVGTALLSVVGLSTFIPPMPLTLWFVSMIIVFYLLFPLLSSGVLWRQVVVAVVISGVGLAMVLLGTGIEKRFVYYFPCFAVGVMLSRYKIPEILSREVVSLSLVGAVCASMLCWSTGLEWSDWRVILCRPVIAFGGAIVILWVSQYLARLRGVALCGGWIAYASMAAYMFHRHIYQYIRDHVWFPNDGLWRVMWLVFVCLPVIMLLGWLIQWVYDRALKLIIKK